jgi:hypothetical protein
MLSLHGNGSSALIEAASKALLQKQESLVQMNSKFLVVMVREVCQIFSHSKAGHRASLCLRFGFGWFG